MKDAPSHPFRSPRQNNPAAKKAATGLNLIEDIIVLHVLNSPSSN
jgi:hypothetical protein